MGFKLMVSLQRNFLVLRTGRISKSSSATALKNQKDQNFNPKEEANISELEETEYHELWKNPEESFFV